MFRAKLARFYGWTHDVIKSMRQVDAVEYYNSATALEAQELLVHLKVADYPEMNKNDRSELHKEIYRKAYPNIRKKSVSATEMARILNHGR